jgi:hypothetical protein
MGDIAGIIGGFNHLENCRVIQFFSLVQFVPSRVTRRMVMGNRLVSVTNSANDIPLHNLHMIDVVKQLYPRRYRRKRLRGCGARN